MEEEPEPKIPIRVRVPEKPDLSQIVARCRNRMQEMKQEARLTRLTRAKQLLSEAEKLMGEEPTM